MSKYSTKIIEGVATKSGTKKKGNIKSFEEGLESINCCPTLSCCENALILFDETTGEKSFIRVEGGALVVYTQETLPKSNL